MAKQTENNNQLADEVARRQKEREEREKKEKEEQKKREAEKIQKKKEREKRIKLKENKEKKRINNIINYPFKTLFQVSSLLALFAFIMSFYWSGNNLLKALLHTFFLFSIVFIFVGLVLLGIYIVKADQKLKELEEEKQRELELQKLEEEKRNQEFARIENVIKSQPEQLPSNIIDDTNLNNSNLEESLEDFKVDDNIENNYRSEIEDQFIEQNLGKNFRDFEDNLNEIEYK